MKDKEQLGFALASGFSYFFISTEEIERTVGLILEVAEEYKYLATVWDLENNQDPEEVFSIMEKGNKNLVIAKNFNWFLKDEYNGINKQFVQMLQNKANIYSTKEKRAVLIIVSNKEFNSAIPMELRREFLDIEFSLPSVGEITKVLDYIIESAKSNPKFKESTEEEKKRIVQNAKGMTEKEVQNNLAYALISGKGYIDPLVVGRLRAKEVEKTAGLKIGDYPGIDFSTLLGYENVKQWALSSINGPKANLAKGLIFLGPPGTGKSHFCKALGTESKRTVIEMEMAELFGSLVGESEKLMKSAISVISSCSPCILFIDEIEKGLSGSSGRSFSGDGGTTKRSMSQFLKFLSDSRPEGVYVVATCNNINAIDPEWIRAERWDGIFFVDLPNEIERKEILKYYKKFYEVEGNLSVKETGGWSGAEIKSCCRIAAMMGKKLDEIKSFIVPVSNTMKESIDYLRKWKEGRTIPASINIKNGYTLPETRNVEF